MTQLRLLWKGLLTVLETFLNWLLTPKILILCLIVLLMGGVTYWAYGHPTIGLVLKGFVLKTLPKWMAASGAFVKRLAVKIPALLTNATFKRYAKAFLIFCSLAFLTDKWIEEKKDKLHRVKKVSRFWLYVIPKKYWRKAHLATQIGIVGVVIAIVVSIPGALYVGAFIVPLTLVQSAAVFIWKRFLLKFLLKIGAGVAAKWIHDKLIALIGPFIPRFVVERYEHYKQSLKQWLNKKGEEIAARKKRKEEELSKKDSPSEPEIQGSTNNNVEKAE